MQSRYIIPIAIFVSCMLLLQNNIDKAFGDVTITTITPVNSVYGTLSATSDCSDIVSGNGIIWVGCNNVLYAIDETNNTIIANKTGVTTSPSANKMLASVTGTFLYLAESTTNINKYQYSVNTITLVGSFVPSGCTIDGTGMIYDELGYIWVACGTQDKIIRFNPATMTTNTFSQDLTDAVGLECDNPDFVSYAHADNIGVIHCGTTNNYVTFSITNPTTVLLLDDEPDGSGETGVFIHERYNKIFVSRSTGISHYSYDSSGIITSLATGLGLGTGYDNCGIEPYLTANVFLVCVDVIANVVQIDSFFSNATGTSGFNPITSNTVAYASSLMNIGLDIQDRVWLAQGNLNNQNYIKITGLNSQLINPTPPVSANCDNVNPDIDGDGLPNLTDPDTDGDGIPNASDTDDDCDGIPDTSDTTPLGNTQSDQTGNITDLGTQIFCTVGINKAACTNTDVKTNGVGLFYLTVLIILSYAFIVFIHYQAIKMINKQNIQVMDAVKVNPVLLLVMLIVDVGTAFYLAWIPDLIFYSTIVTMVGLAGFGIYKQVKGGGNG